VTRRLLDRWRESRATVVVPVYRGRSGHPVVLGENLRGELMAVEEATLGLRAIMTRHKAETESVEIENPCVIVDLNTPDEYEDALRAFNDGDWRE
jgi:molybdenum cofactor cytidylyltransferase